MKTEYRFAIVVILIATFIVGVVLVRIIRFCVMNKKKQLQPPEPPQWQRRIVSAPTHQPRKIDVENGVVHLTIGSPEDRLRSRSDTIVKKPVVPDTVDDSFQHKAPTKSGKLQGQRDDGDFAVMMSAASTSAFDGGGDSGYGGGGCGGGCYTGGGGDSGYSGGDSGCGGGGCGGC